MRVTVHAECNVLKEYLKYLSIRRHSYFLEEIEIGARHKVIYFGDVLPGQYIGLVLKYCDECVCMSVCLSARAAQKKTRTFELYEILLYMLTAAAARYSLEDNGICHNTSSFVVLWTTLYLPIIVQAKATPTGPVSQQRHHWVKCDICDFSFRFHVKVDVLLRRALSVINKLATVVVR